MKKELQQLSTALNELHQSNDVSDAAYSTLKFAVSQLKNCNLQNVSGSLPTSEELQEIVVKIAYSQQGEEQSDDCYAKMGMLHEFISRYVNGNDS
jgi:hypothetical protein